MAKKIEYNKIKAAAIRGIRTIAFQMPAVIAYATQVADVVKLPELVIPALVCLGAIFQALDKFIRDTAKGL